MPQSTKGSPNYKNGGKDYFGNDYNVPELLKARDRTARLLSYLGVEGGIRKVNWDNPAGNGYKGPALEYKEVPLAQFPELDKLEMSPSSALEESIYQYQVANPLKKFFARKVTKDYLSKIISGAKLPDAPDTRPETKALRARMNAVLGDHDKRMAIQKLLDTGHVEELDNLPAAPDLDNPKPIIKTRMSVDDGKTYAPIVPVTRGQQ